MSGKPCICIYIHEFAHACVHERNGARLNMQCSQGSVTAGALPAPLYLPWPSIPLR
jgi:hypothetical protein